MQDVREVYVKDNEWYTEYIKVEGKQTDLASIRHQMTLAEVSHLIGFVFVTGAAVYQSYNVSLIFGLAMMIPKEALYSPITSSCWYK